MDRSEGLKLLIQSFKNKSVSVSSRIINSSTTLVTPYTRRNAIQRLSAVQNAFTNKSSDLIININNTNSIDCKLLYICSQRYHTIPNGDCSHCICQPGYYTNSIDEQPICYDINECISYNPCDIYSICTNTQGGFICSPCPQFFSGNGYYRCFSPFNIYFLILSILSHIFLYIFIIHSLQIRILPIFFKKYTIFHSINTILSIFVLMAIIGWIGLFIYLTV